MDNQILSELCKLKDEDENVFKKGGKIGAFLDDRLPSTEMELEKSLVVSAIDKLDAYFLIKNDCPRNREITIQKLISQMNSKCCPNLEYSTKIIWLIANVLGYKAETNNNDKKQHLKTEHIFWKKILLKPYILAIALVSVVTVVPMRYFLVSYTEKPIEQTEVTFTDPRDGQVYKIVKIGSQVWMAQNLNYAAANGSWCYNNDTANCKIYGRLYDWNTANKLCPIEWHMPSNAEWNKLLLHIDGNTSTDSLYKSKTAGVKLKATSGWKDDNGKNGNGTDNYDFSALPGGYRKGNGSFDNAGYYGNWWSSSEHSSNNAYRRYMNYNNDSAGWYDKGNGKSNGYSVRCLRD